MKKNLILISLLWCLALFGTGCAKSRDASTAVPIVEKTDHSLSDVATIDPVNPDTSAQSDLPVEILLFNGIGTSTSDWKSLEQILISMGRTYRLVNSATLNSLSLTGFKAFKMILIPGGNSNIVNDSLSLSTKIRVRQAVRDAGLSYLGLCAGAFAAVGIDSRSNFTAYYGFAVAQGDYLKHWYPNGNSALIAVPTKVLFADGSQRSLIWWDGPATPEWQGGVVARYPDGQPAISQTWTGLGFVLLSGPHPEAPPSWQWTSGNDPDGLDYDIARKLILSALNRQPLRAF